MKTLIAVLPLLFLASCAAKRPAHIVYIPVATPTLNQTMSQYEKGCTEALVRVGTINQQYANELDKLGKIKAGGK